MSEILHEGDCVEVMKSLQAETIDMIFADPPFNIGKRYGGKSSNDNRLDYYDWCAEWIAQGFRLLKPTGTFYLMTIARHIFRMGYEMEKHGIFVNKVEWRNVSASHLKKQFWPATQSIAVFGKTEAYKFNTYAQTRKISKNNLRWGRYSTEPKGQFLDYWDDIPFVYAGSVVHPEAIMKKGTNEKAHPAQMPVNLPGRAILFSTDEGDMVLDPFNGSGTTGAACIKLSRSYIGIERESQYCQMSRERWERQRQQPALFSV
jgi:DNA modification methylase